MNATFKCKQCNAELSYTPGSGKMVCEYCDTEHSIEEMDKILGSNEAGAAGAEGQAKKKVEEPQKMIDDDGSEILVYKCSYCGGSIQVSDDTAATECPYCERTLVVGSGVSEGYRPRYVLPFATSKEQAKQALKDYLKKKPLISDSFARDQNIEKMKGIYIPFWLYSAKVDFHLVGTGFKTKRRGDRSYQERYHVERTGKFEIKNAPVDASSKTPDDIIESIEPFNFSELKDFATPYLSGFLAERYDEDGKKCEDRLDVRIYGSAEDLSKKGSNYNRINIDKGRSYIKKSDFTKEYALLPSWMMYSKYDGKDYVFAMNGQTGKVTGNLPIDKNKLMVFIAKWAGISAAAAFVVKIVYTLI